MDKKVEISLRLKEFIEKKFSGNAAELARKMGIRRSELEKYLKAVSEIGNKQLLRLANNGCNITWLLLGIGNPLLGDNADSLEINYEEKYSGNAQSFAGGAGASQPGDPAMQGNFIGEPKEIHYHNQLNEKLFEKLIQQYEDKIVLLNNIVDQKESLIQELLGKIKTLEEGRK